MNEANHNLDSKQRHGAAAFWKLASAFGAIAFVIATSFFLNSALAAKKAAPRVENDPEFAAVVNRVNLAFEKSWREAAVEHSRISVMAAQRGRRVEATNAQERRQDQACACGSGAARNKIGANIVWAKS